MITSKQASKISDFLRSHFDKQLAEGFEWKSLFNEYVKCKGKNFDDLTWDLQGNTMGYFYFKRKDIEVRIPFKNLGTNNRFEIRARFKKQFNTLKTTNTLLTTLIHSRNAEINVKFCLEFNKIYKYQPPRIHDSFDIPPHLYENAKKVYKTIVYNEIFSQKLSDIFPLPDDAPEDLKKRFEKLT